MPMVTNLQLLLGYPAEIPRHTIVDPQTISKLRRQKLGKPYKSQNIRTSGHSSVGLLGTAIRRNAGGRETMEETLASADRRFESER